MSARDDEFYVGYVPQAPPATGRFVRRVALALVALGGLLGLALALAHGPFGPGVFEFGVERSFEGTIVERPYPELLVDRPGTVAPSAAAASRYLLVAPFKFGAAALVEGLDGRRVRLAGSLVYRGGRTMIEIAPGTVTPLAASASAAGPVHEEDLGLQTLAGEIVDSKCYLGVMNPGNLKTHRDCATRCISGGIPPIFIVRDGSGRVTSFLLVSSSGKTVNREVLSMIAEPLEITGRVTRRGEDLVLWADPAGYRRLDP